jgi:pilus assembly protein CpaF
VFLGIAVEELNLNNPDLWSPGLRTALRPIMPLLKEEDVTEIEVFSYNHVRVKGGKWKGHKKVDAQFWESFIHLRAACTGIADVTGRTLNEKTPIYDGRLPGGQRIHIALPPCSADIYVTIRKFPKEPMTVEKLLSYGSIDENIAAMLKGLVDLKKNLIVGGSTESGKTSLLNALSLQVDPEEKILTIEDARELQIQSPVWQALETVKPWEKDVKEIDISDLVVTSLRMSPDRIIVGEVRNKEAMYLLRSFSTGHKGGMGTVHCSSAADAFGALEFLAAMDPNVNLSADGLMRLVSRAIEVVVFVEKMEEDGSRKITEIIELDNPHALLYENGRIHYRYRTLAQFNKSDEFGEIVNGLPTVLGSWEFPHCPSQVTKRSIAAKNINPDAKSYIQWPQESLEAPDVVLNF